MIDIHQLISYHDWQTSTYFVPWLTNINLFRTMIDKHQLISYHDWQISTYFVPWLTSINLFRTMIDHDGKMLMFDIKVYNYMHNLDNLHIGSVIFYMFVFYTFVFYYFIFYLLYLIFWYLPFLYVNFFTVNFLCGSLYIIQNLLFFMGRLGWVICLSWPYWVRQWATCVR